jgi:hypothetical protein
MGTRPRSQSRVPSEPMRRRTYGGRRRGRSGAASHRGSSSSSGERGRGPSSAPLLRERDHSQCFRGWKPRLPTLLALGPLALASDAAAAAAAAAVAAAFAAVAAADAAATASADARFAASTAATKILATAMSSASLASLRAGDRVGLPHPPEPAPGAAIACAGQRGGGANDEGGGVCVLSREGARTTPTNDVGEKQAHTVQSRMPRSRARERAALPTCLG